MARVIQVQVRCAGCNRRLADLVNEIEGGQALVELKCPRCGQPHLEVIRPQRSDTAPKASSTSRINTTLSLILSSIVPSLWTATFLTVLGLCVVIGVPSSFGAPAERLSTMRGRMAPRDQAERGLDTRVCTLEKHIGDAKQQKADASVAEQALSRETAKHYAANKATPNGDHEWGEQALCSSGPVHQEN